jgi:DNA transformation protein
MPNSADFIAHVLEMMRPAAPARARAMFGGHGIYAGGPIIGIVVDDILYLKTDESNRAEFTELALEPWVYLAKTGERNSTGYYRAPDETLESPEAMRAWLRSAQGAALRSAARPRAPGSAKVAVKKASPRAKRR